MTNDWNYPIILVRPGKGVWLPEPHAAPFVDIIDIVFLGGKLYGITQAEDLVSLDIAFDDNNGAPDVTGFHAWSDIDEDDHNHEAENNDANNNDHCHDKVSTEEEDNNMRATKEVTVKTGDDMLSEGITTYWEDDDVPYEPSKDLVAVIWYLVGSCGKLFMVKRQLQCPSYGTAFTCKVAVLEVNLGTCAWAPVSGGLDGQTFFISERFCKSIAAHGDIEGDTIYFADTGETFDVMSRTLSPPQRDIDHGRSMWIFSPALVV
uniref:Uncharacterized protein n=1 Tax=Avena sativa TaxID=4498 RepID=A0ACD5XXJ6_AVESA